ncbi:MAG: DnaJ domain-containing protein [Clostridia bacterium]|nr:DnaJ domain-containing protein [Clostridia bacterium]
MKNYYEMLEVDIHASQEIIDKAFKTLAKKYHPDTQDDDKKEWAEEQFKLLNEAYEVLSDKTKRDEYTKELEFDKNSEINALLLKNADLEVQIENLQLELESLKNRNSSEYRENINYHPSSNMYNNTNVYHTNDVEQYDSPKEDYTNTSTYYESYYHPIKSKFKNFLAFFITLGVIIFIAFVIWNIPYTHNLLIEMYKENFVIQAIVNFFYK